MVTVVWAKAAVCLLKGSLHRAALWALVKLPYIAEIKTKTPLRVGLHCRVNLGCY